MSRAGPVVASGFRRLLCSNHITQKGILITITPPQTAAADQFSTPDIYSLKTEKWDDDDDDADVKGRSELILNKIGGSNIFYYSTFMF